ncbi:hypothetical protein [Flavobacterium agricola]|uniref:hypothetical protein n=1 Tax=Flavobacterium agricola TaxID=2870839 RepID=UPI002222E96B|nr:hypothetical protein [Flavobacterium agricola]
MTITDKQEIVAHLVTFLNTKIKTLQTQIQDLATDAQNDAKGSAGDKHETGLAMMHLEQEKLSAHLKQALVQQQELQKIVLNVAHKVVSLGSLITTANGVFFVSDAFPSFKYQNKTIFPLSVNAPIYVFLKGQQEGTEVVFNNKKIKLLQIV